MSNRALLSFLQGGDRLTAFHVSAAGPAGRREGPTHFSGERFEFSAKTHGGDAATDKKDYSKKENREEAGPKKKKAKTDDDSGSDSDDDGPHYKSDGIHKKGSDAGVWLTHCILMVPSAFSHRLLHVAFSQMATARRARARRARASGRTRTATAKRMVSRKRSNVCVSTRHYPTKATTSPGCVRFVKDTYTHRRAWSQLSTSVSTVYNSETGLKLPRGSQ